MTEIVTEIDRNRRVALPELIDYLKANAASPMVVELAMLRHGIDKDVARLVARCIAGKDSVPNPSPAEPVILPKLKQSYETQNVDCGKSAALFLKRLSTFLITWVLLVGCGATLGFSLGFESGLAQGMETGLDRITDALNATWPMIGS